MVILLSSYFASKSINFITYHAKFQVKIPTGSPIILTLNFVFEPISLSATRKEKKEPGQNFESWAESGRVIIKRKRRQGLNTSKQGMLKFTLQQVDNQAWFDATLV